ncbi:MAG: hypothetical protein IIX80_03495 [Clostridia bacterium]|nr:hypothetical protein [Clostridia bacterium]
MAKINPRRADLKATVSAFPGLGEEHSLAEPNAQEIRNFRIRQDGSLEKRAGWYVKHALPGTVRGFWKGNLNGEEVCFAVCDEVIYRIRSDGSRSPAGLLETGSNRVRFFLFQDGLYAQDGHALHAWRSSSASFEPVEPYAPLHGYNWHPTACGEILEQLNLLTPRLRVHYFNSTGTEVFHLPYPAKSIDLVRANGVTASYTLGADNVTLTVNGASDKNEIEVAFTRLYPHALCEQLQKTTGYYLDLEEEQQTLFLFGAPQGYRLFASFHVDAASMLNYCKLSYPNTDPLYFREQELLHLGSASRPITALCRQYDRILAFSAEDVWSLHWDKEAERREPIPVLHGVGCMNPDALALLENDVLLFNKGGLYRLHSTVGHPDDFAVTRLSSEVTGLLNPSKMTDVLLQVLPAENEIRIRDTADTQGLVWIRRIDSACWYCFDNVHANLLLQDGTSPAFAAGSSVCVFDRALSQDNGYPISATYQSGYLSFASPETVKRALRAALCAVTQGDSVRLLLETEQISREFLLQGKQSATPEVFDLRVALGRFRFLRFRISTAGIQKSLFYRFHLYSNL